MTITNEILNCALIYILDHANEPWFNGKCVGSALGYTNPRKSLRDHVDDDDMEKLGNFRGNETFPLPINQKNTIYINESGLYSLIMSSKLPSSKVFKRWITKEVLPSIRKTGSYSVVRPLTDVQERLLKLDESKTRVDEMKLLKDLLESNNVKFKQCASDSLMNIMQTNQKLLKSEDLWCRDIITLCKDELNKLIDFREACKIGRYVKAKYIEKYDKQPDKYEKFVNGNNRSVNAYPIECEKHLIKWIGMYYQ
jgi:prophage antirepressor-like protein